MARKNSHNMIDLTPIVKGNTTKIGKVGITKDTGGSSKIRFRFNGQDFSHGVGKLDNDHYRNKVYEQVKAIAIDLFMNRFNPDTWKMTYFGVDQNSKVIDFPKSQPTIVTQPPVKSELTLVDIWENYLKVKGDRLSYNTLTRDFKTASNHINYAVSVNPDCVYLDNIEKFVSILKDKYSDSTLSHDFCYYSSACNIAMRQGKIKGNPFTVYIDNLAKSPKKGMGLVLSFTKEDKDKIIETFYDNPYLIYGTTCALKDGTKKTYYRKDSKELAVYYAPMIEFKFLTGVRPGEAHAVKWSDIKDHGTPVISITKSVTCDGKHLKPTKNGVTRKIPINNALADLIDRLPRIDNPENLIFPSVTSLPYLPTVSSSPYPSMFFNEIVNALFNDGLIDNNLTYYCTRHYFATQLIRSGLDVATVASWIGDKQSTVMDYYYAADQSMVIPDIL
jgi:integrase